MLANTSVQFSACSGHCVGAWPITCLGVSFALCGVINGYYCLAALVTTSEMYMAGPLPAMQSTYISAVEFFV
jgi:hypothetical protein